MPHQTRPTSPPWTEIPAPAGPYLRHWVNHHGPGRRTSDLSQPGLTPQPPPLDPKWIKREEVEADLNETFGPAQGRRERSIARLGSMEAAYDYGRLQQAAAPTAAPVNHLAGGQGFRGGPLQPGK